ncbi:MAG: phosphoribosylanthranilate isomerase [Desulfobacteraceae bacterium]|nr:MAG: phosphoribosylanthranilate isomerase [Desulfobacteraceae bacterium]
MIRVKICGIKNLAEARAAIKAGADVLGFVFAESKRKVTPDQVRDIIAAIPPFVSTTGVFVNEQADTVKAVAERSGLGYLQFQGEESPDYCTGFRQPVIKGFAVKDQAGLAQLKAYRVAAYLLDSHVPGQRGGTGRVFNWDLLRDFRPNRPIILAGGLNPGNVAAAVETVQPYAVDVSSGVEDASGQKDFQKMLDFVRLAKAKGLSRMG